MSNSKGNAITEALRIYLDAGLSDAKAVEVCRGHLAMWRDGQTWRDPVQFARHFVSLRQVVKP